MRHQRIFLALAVGLVHCGGSGVGTPADTGVNSDGDAGALAPYDSGASPWDYGDGGTAGSAQPEGGCAAEDVLDDEGQDTNCDGADGVVGRDVYVSGAGGSDTNPGTPGAPMRTVPAALSLAATTKGSVVVQAGSYTVDQLTQVGTWAVVGGYGSSFAGAPRREGTILVAPDTGLLLDKGQSARLSHLTVQGGQPSVATQPTAHGIRSNVATLSLDDVVVQTGDGLSQLAATAGTAGAPGRVGGPLTCNGAAQPAYTTGSSTGSSVEGKPGGNATAKTPPGAGTAGYPGTDGKDATGALRIAAGLVIGDVGAAGSADGHPGYGAPSGGAGTYNGQYFWAGTGGSGGCPGGGGAGGSSGGSAVAVLALSGTVTITRSRLVVGLGGDGAAGGAGGVGGAGAWGGSPYWTNDTPMWPTPEKPGVPPCKTVSDDPMSLNCSAFGGLGGAGGAGGHGGGGGGGWSVALALMSTAQGTVDATTVVSLGSPGNGGQGNGGGHAPNGRRQPTLNLD